MVVLSQVRERKMRFSELRRDLPGISQKTLTSTLRQLERNGFVTRTAFATIPPRVDYEVTGLGLELLEVTDLVVAFGDRHRDDIENSQKRFDDRSEDGPDGLDTPS